MDSEKTWETSNYVQCLIYIAWVKYDVWYKI